MGPVRQFGPDPGSQNQKKTWFYFAWGEFITESVSFREIKDEGKGELEIYSGLVLKIYLYTAVLKADIFFPFFFHSCLTISRSPEAEFRRKGPLAGWKILPVVENEKDQALLN